MTHTQHLFSKHNIYCRVVSPLRKLKSLRSILRYSSRLSSGSTTSSWLALFSTAGSEVGNEVDANIWPKDKYVLTNLLGSMSQTLNPRLNSVYRTTS